MEAFIVTVLLIMIAFMMFLNQSGAKVRFGARRHDPTDEAFDRLKRPDDGEAKLRIAKPLPSEYHAQDDTHDADVVVLPKNLLYNEPRVVTGRPPGTIGSVRVFAGLADERARRHGQHLN